MYGVDIRCVGERTQPVVIKTNRDAANQIHHRKLRLPSFCMK